MGEKERKECGSIALFISCPSESTLHKLHTGKGLGMKLGKTGPTIAHQVFPL